MPKAVVIDLSHHNTIPSSLAPAKASGIVGVIHKVTEGTTYVDDKVAARYDLAKKAGMMWGLYHFVRPGKMKEQVANFLSNSREVSDPNTLFVLDYEDTGVSLDDCVKFLNAVEVLTKRLPVIYSGHVLKEKLNGKADPRLSKYPLWLAQYGPEAEVPPGWDTYWLWQFTEDGSCPGINPPVDLNACAGSVQQLIEDWTGGEAPAPAPTPEAVVRVNVEAPEGIVVEVSVNRVKVK